MRPGDLPLPHSPEAEEALLGTILLDAASMATAVEHLRNEDFFLERHQKVFQAMVRLFETGAGIDVVSVTEVLRNGGLLEAVGGASFLTGLLRHATSPEGVEAYARMIRQRALVRRMIQTAGAIVSDGYSAELEPEDYLDQAEKRVLEIREEQARRSVVTLQEAIEHSMEQIRQQYERRAPLTGVTTGYAGLNHMLGGFQPSDLVIVAARPSMGKTSFALNLALNAAAGARTGQESTPAAVLFCSLEMNLTQITDRLLSIRTGIDARRIRTGHLTPSEMRMLEDMRVEMRDLPIYIDDSARLSVLELRAKARRLHWKEHLGLVMVDYLQLMEPLDKRVSREQQISEISRSLKALAKELQVPVVALSQLSRAPEQRPDKRPMLSDLRESGAIEQDADVVMFLFRPEYYDRDKTKPEDRGILEVRIDKQRNGPTGVVRLAMRMETMTIADLPDDVNAAPQ